MAERLDLLLGLPEDLFKYNSYQVQPQTVPSQRPFFIPALRSKGDAIAINDFLCQQMTAFNPQYPTDDYLPQYPSPPTKTLYPTLDSDYAQHADLTPSTNLYPQLFEQTPLPSSTYVGMGTRMPYDQTRLVYAGTLTKAPLQRRSGSEELVDDMEKMDVDSEAKEEKAKKEEVTIKAEDDEENDKVKATKEKHYELIKKLQKMVQERLLDWPAEPEEEGEKKSPIIKKESPVDITVE